MLEEFFSKRMTSPTNYSMMSLRKIDISREELVWECELFAFDYYWLAPIPKCNGEDIDKEARYHWCWASLYNYICERDSSEAGDILADWKELMLKSMALAHGSMYELWYKEAADTVDFLVDWIFERREHDRRGR